MDYKEGNIFQKLCDIAAEIPAISKDAQSKGTFTFNYRGIDQVYNALSGIFVKHRVVTIPEVLRTELYERKTDKGITLHKTTEIRFTFLSDDGSFVSAIMVGEGMDSGDKSTSKSISIAHKYCLFTMFMIPTNEIVDPDGEQFVLKEEKATIAPVIKEKKGPFAKTSVITQDNPEEENPFIEEKKRIEEIKKTFNAEIVTPKDTEKKGGGNDDIPEDFDV